MQNTPFKLQKYKRNVKITIIWQKNDNKSVYLMILTVIGQVICVLLAYFSTTILIVKKAGNARFSHIVQND